MSVAAPIPTGRLQTLEAVTNETNRELRAARLAVTRGQAPAELLLDRALASIEHLSEVAETMTLWMDELLDAASKVNAEIGALTYRPGD